MTCALVEGEAFFDVFIELHVPSRGETWFNAEPLRMERVIRALPPLDEPYESPQPAAVPLYDAASGEPRATVRYELLHADPLFPAGGLDCFDTRMRNEIALFETGYTA